jgi:cysteine desulfurase / selenocysteine lyase
MNLFPDESKRREAFPICQEKIFLAHAAICTFPRAVADAMHRYVELGALSHTEDAHTWRDVAATRVLGSRLLGCSADEIALLGPTSIGLSLFANGIDWQPGDEVVCYGDDYPANVYPWLDLQRRGVVVRLLQPENPGEITPELVEAALTPRTRLVALASAHYFTGYRINVGTIGSILRGRGILFAVDAIQTLGAFPFDSMHVDFLSADAHKWLLGPCAIGLVMVKREHFETLRPTLLGAWNVQSPGFLAQSEIKFVDTAQRYEPGALNFPGIYAMKAGLELLLDVAIWRIGERLLELKAALLARLDPLGFTVLGPREGRTAHAITTVRRDGADHEALHTRLLANGIVSSLRRDRAGKEWLRFSPHYYNTEAEFDRVAEVLKEAQ